MKISFFKNALFKAGRFSRFWAPRLRRGTLYAAALTAFIIVCQPKTSHAEVIDRIVAVINDTVITLSELNAATAVALDMPGGETKPDEKKIIEIKGRILDSLIEQKLVKQASDKAGIEVSEREIDNAIDDVKKQNNMTQETLLVALAQSGLTYREYKEQLREQIRQAKFITKEFRSKINVEDAEITEYYNRNIDEFYGPHGYRLNMIFLKPGGERAQQQRLKEILDGFNKGEKFETLARRFSEGANAEYGGDMGLVKSGELDPAIENAAAGLGPGDISGPIKTANGTYIIQLKERAEGAPRPLSEVREDIRDRLFKKTMDDRFRFWLEETKRFAHIDTRL